MFIGSWKINTFVSVVAFLFVFVRAMSMNTAFTSLIRAGLAFVFFYIITYFFRWVWDLASKDVLAVDLQKKQIEDSIQGKDKFNQLDKDEAEITKVSQYIKDLIDD
jgi:hypothetical protein